MQLIEFEEDANSIISALNEKFQWEGDYTARRMDGSNFIAHGQATVVRNEDGKIIGYQSAVVDVTQRKQTENSLRESEDRFRKVFEEGSMGMAMSSLVDGSFISVNRAFCNMLGYTEEELMQLSFATITHPDFRSQDRDAVRKMIEGKIQEHFTEKQYIKKNGDVIWVTRALTKIFSADGKSFYALALISDITARKQADDEIKKLNETLEKRVADRTAQLEAANKELEAFSYSVSHDLRAPLRHISGFSEMLTKEAKLLLPEKSQHFLEIINTSAQKMGILIDDLLSFSKTGRAEMVKTTFNMNIAIQEARLQIKFPSRNRIITWNFVNLPYVFGDYNLLLLVWINLLDNAVKYTRTREEAVISIDCRETGEEFIFSVSDNGVGFDMQYANKLFGVFQRLHSVTEFEGTGIGLANVRRIILRHGGRTWAEAKENEGASFYFSLPKN
jgi:PAS domain S-box-containing protein